MSNSSQSFDLTELQLEQELRQMFEVDSQKDVETYFTCVQELHPESWKEDIQTMYRVIHTIKGGSVTVNADAILQVATVLEDMLSELRYLETSPSLDDGRLRQMLQEGGEIIASVLGSDKYGKETSVVQHKIEHIESLKQQIQENYLADWDEQTQLQLEFAEQGFDLVVLDLEMAIDRLPQEGKVVDSTLELAKQLLEELAEIGRELELASGWNSLLENASKLIENPDNQIWKVQWEQYFHSLKAYIKQGAKNLDENVDWAIEAKINELDFDLDEIDRIVDEISTISSNQLPLKDRDRIKVEAEDLDNGTSILDLDEIDDLLDEIDIVTNDNLSPQKQDLENQIDDLDIEIDIDFDCPETIDKSKLESVGEDRQDPKDILDLDEIDFIANKNLTVVNKEIEIATDTFDIDGKEIAQNGQQKVKVTPQKVQSNSPKIASPSPKVEARSAENIQVPIPLTKLDLSARSIIDTLMIARTMGSNYQSLHQDLKKLIDIAKDSVQYLAQLRQIQNDYTLLNDLDKRIARDADSPTLERYRQGYVTINRLLENSLRLSEIGTEAEQTAQETTEKLQQLTTSINELKDIVEDSRLVPFRNLTFRVRAIVRDLITRYGKSVNLKLAGEQIELDVGTTRRLEPILLHLVRNAYDHGLESNEERTARGKSAQGNLSLTLQRFGSTYTLQLQDDGKGIDPIGVRAKAQKLKLPLTRTDTPSELLSVICQAGFSSSTEVSAISGRGVGMDVVAEQISLLNGSLTLETQPGKGTTFKINFPVPHLLVPCLLIQSGDRNFAIPTEQIIHTSVWNSLDAAPINNSEFSFDWEITEEDKTTPGIDVLGYWYPKFRKRILDSSAIAVYLKPQPESSGFWLLADKILGRLDLKIQPFPAPIVPPKGIMGVSLQTDSSLIPVIEVNSLQEHLTQSNSAGAIGKTKATIGEDSWEIQESQTILIVDDAALMRRRIEASLSAYGYATHTCADGLEAWNWLKINPHPMLIITDIEMPQMDGFTLIDCCRANHLTFPILVVSSRLAEEWGKEARRLGATDFLTKGFSTGELISKVNSLITV